MAKQRAGKWEEVKGEIGGELSIIQTSTEGGRNLQMKSRNSNLRGSDGKRSSTFPLLDLF